MTSIIQRLIEAAEHFQICDFAGQSIEFRCEYCVAAQETIVKARAIVRAEKARGVADSMQDYESCDPGANPGVPTNIKTAIRHLELLHNDHPHPTILQVIKRLEDERRLIRLYEKILKRL